jgi:hypothetical protein
VPAVKTERIEATVQHQKDLEDELERLQPSLYRKALDLKPDGNWDIKAPIVEHLSRGLEKMQESGKQRGGGDSIKHPGYPDKLRQNMYTAEGHESMDSDEEPHAKDSAFPATDAKSTPEESSGPGTDLKKGRGRNVWKMLRSAR